MGVLPMHLVDHLLRVGEVGIEKLHRVPQVVVAPILPVLNDSVEGNPELAVPVHHGEQLGAALVPLAALVETIGPQGQHGHLATEMAHAAYHAIGVATVDEIVVGPVAHLTLEHHVTLTARLGGDKLCGRVVIPIDAIALDALEEMGIVFQVALHHEPVLAALRHLAVLQQSHAVYALVGIDGESLPHPVAPLVGSGGDGRESRWSCRGEHASVGGGKGHGTVFDGDNQRRRPIDRGTVAPCDTHPDLLWMGGDNQRRCDTTGCAVVGNAYDVGGEKFYVLCLKG